MTRPLDPPSKGKVLGSRPVPAVSPSDILARLRTAVWVYDFGTMRIVWANGEALRLWDAESVAALETRDMRTEMSKSVKTRLDQHREDFERFPDREISEMWTLYPDDHPVRVQAVLRRHDFAAGHFGMLVEARPEEVVAPETIRSADALLHAQTIIALYDQAGHALYANPAFRATFGPGDTFFGREFVSPADLFDCLEGLKTAGEHRLTTRVRTRSGVRWFDIHAIRCKDAVTGDGAFHVNMLDVTEAREHEHELREARDLAEGAVKARSQFLAVMSHELRTPLNGILGMVNLLKASCREPEQKRMLEVVGRSGLLMLDIVENILQLVDIESGKIEMVAEEFDPALLVDAAIETAREAASDKSVALMSITTFDDPVLYRHDVDLLRRLLRILLDNAVKFTASGYILARVGPGPSGGLVFEVADTGCGIAPEQTEKVFDCFYQVDGSPTRPSGGTGIGLTIARAIVEQWGGRIEVESEPGRGSVFRFEVPATRVSVSTTSPPEAGATAGRSPHLRLVDT